MINATLAASYETEGYTDRALYPKEIMKMLDEHGIFYRQDSFKIMAIERYGNAKSIETDTTGWTLFDMLNFLNY